MTASGYRPTSSFGKLSAVLAFCLTLAINVHAQRFAFHGLGPDEGLISGQTTCLAQDRNGVLWIGTPAGLARFDGRTITNYATANGLLNNNIHGLLADSSGQLWIGSATGLSRYNGRTFVHYPLQTPGARGTNTQQIQKIRDTVWWRVQGDVFYVAGGRIQYYNTPGAAGTVTAMLMETTGKWLAKDSSLYHYERGRWETITLAIPPGGAKPVISCIFRDHEGKVWLGTNTALYYVQGRAATINAQPSLFYPPISAITQDAAGALWLSTGSGIVKVEGTSMQQFGKKNGLSDAAFTDVLTDAEGNLWMASDGQGVFSFAGTPFTMIDESVGLPKSRITALAYKDSLFIGTAEGGVYTFKNQVSQVIFPSPLGGAVSSILVSKRGRLWVGTRGGGLWSYDGNIYKQYKSPERSFPSDNILNVYEDNYSRLWIAFTNGLVLYENDSFKAVVAQRAVYTLRDIGDGKILIATDKGLLQYLGGELTEYKTNSVADSAAIRSFVMTAKVLWMATGNRGLIRHDPETGRTAVADHTSGLKTDALYNVTVDKDGNAWCSAAAGLYRIQVAADGTPTVTLFGRGQGINGAEQGVNTILRAGDGSIWLGTADGVVHYQGQKGSVSNEHTNLVLTAVKIAGQPGLDTKWYDSTDQWYGVPLNLRLPASKNSVSFQFQAISLSSGGSMLYRYRVEGLEQQWSEWSEQNTAAYPALPPGSYVLHVQCRNAEGQFNGELKYPFTIATPFVQTTWFRYGALGACILLGVLMQYAVARRRQRRMQDLLRLRLDEAARVRYRTEEDFHDQLGNHLAKINVLTSMLKNKMPHNSDVQRIAVQIKENTDRMYEGAQDILWLQKEENSNLYELLQHMREFGEAIFYRTETAFTFNGIDEDWQQKRMPLDVNHNLAMILKEAMLNAHKHAAARNVTIDVVLRRRDILQLWVRDDGRGFDIQPVKNNVGIVSMASRAARLGGRLYIDSKPGKGTTVTLSFRVPRR